MPAGPDLFAPGGAPASVHSLWIARFRAHGRAAWPALSLPIITHGACPVRARAGPQADPAVPRMIASTFGGCRARSACARTPRADPRPRTKPHARISVIPIRGHVSAVLRPLGQHQPRERWCVPHAAPEVSPPGRLRPVVEDVGQVDATRVVACPSASLRVLADVRASRPAKCAAACRAAPRPRSGPPAGRSYPRSRMRTPLRQPGIPPECEE